MGILQRHFHILMMARLAALALLGLVFTQASALAAQDDARLDDMFAKLRLAETNQHARPLEKEIWRIWSERNDEKSNELMRNGALAMSHRNYNAALINFNSLVDHDPEFAEAWNKRATLHYLMGEFSASIKDIERTLALEPRHFGALSGMGLIFMAIGNDAAAVKSFEKALEINPHMPGPKYHMETLKKRLAGSPT